MPTVTARALSIRQPHVEQIFTGEKAFENRTFKTPHRGPIWIHASSWDRKPTREELSNFSDSEYRDIVRPWDQRDTLPVAAIIGVVELVDILTTDEIWILSQTDVGANKLAQSEAGMLYPSEREGFLDRFRHVHEFIRSVDEELREEHAQGPLCWVLRNPRRLKKPIEMGGKLNLWKLELPTGLRFV